MEFVDLDDLTQMAKIPVNLPPHMNHRVVGTFEHPIQLWN